MKEYFSHDLHSRHDRKIAKLFKELKLAGIGAYWCLIEMLHEERGYIPLSEIENISFELRVKPAFILKIINDFELFSSGIIEKALNENEKASNGFEYFWSESALSRIAFKDEKSIKARESANNRWSKDANALRQKNDRNAIKVNNSKVQYSKEENTVDTVLKLESAVSPPSFKKMTEKDFGESLKPFLGKYSKEMIREFYDYWRENDPNGKMRFQLEKTWEVKMRLSRWHSKPFNKVSLNGHDKEPPSGPSLKILNQNQDGI